MPITKKFKPFDHQTEAHAKVIEKGGIGGLQHDVGCGKTITVFWVFETLRKFNPGLKLLVVCPKNVINKRGWGDKVRDWSDWNFYNCHAMTADRTGPVDIYAINFEALLYEKHYSRIVRILQKWDFMVVIDESHRIKNHNAQATKVLNGYNRGRKKVIGLRKMAKHRMILSGTMDPNSRFEYFSQCLFLTPEIFGDKVTNFRHRYFYMKRKTFTGEIETKPVERDYYQDFKKGFKLDLIPEKADEFFAKIGEYIHFAKKDECLDLPDQIDEIRLVSMDDKQKKLYRQMERDLVIEFNEMEEVTASYAMTKIQKLNQIANGFVIDDSGSVHAISNKKLDELSAVLEEIGDSQVIIWGHWVKEIEMILKALGDKAIGFYGNDADQVIHDFVEGKYQYLVANPQSKSEGLDLFNANYQIFMSLNYSLLEYAQCRGRTHRPGQTKNCYYLHMISEGTIEEEIYLVLQGKKTEQELAHEFAKRIKSSNKHHSLAKK